MEIMSPKITVVITTYNRAKYLEKALDAFVSQTLSHSEYELVVINDGSSDDTEKVAMIYKDRLPMRYFYHDNRGLAASKNVGIAMASAPLILFMDDDDLASPDLLEQHIKSHEDYPDEKYAVLGNTELDTSIVHLPLMKYVTGKSGYLFSYPSIRDGDILDFRYFWGGRSSCKTGLLRKHGVFNPVFNFGCEDIELGYRLSLIGLKVVYRKKAVTTMVRPITIDEFFDRLVRQGRSQYVFSTLHKSKLIQQYTEVVGADKTWVEIEPIFEALKNSARKLDSLVRARSEKDLDIDDFTLQLLHRAYVNSFSACKLMGINMGMGHDMERIFAS